MGRKCPPGVICIENMTLIFIISIIILVAYIGYKQLNNNTSITSSSNIHNTQNMHECNNKPGLYPRPGYTFSNIKEDVLLNPYEAPLRDNSVMQHNVPNNNNNNNNVVCGVPINIQTQSYDTNYRQIGILTRVNNNNNNNNNKETILPLMGRPLITNRNKWNFYSMSENNQLLKLPITYNGKKCMGEYGCDDLTNGDIVQVDGYNDSFKVTAYESNSPKYIPYL